MHKHSHPEPLNKLSCSVCDESAWFDALPVLTLVWRRGLRFCPSRHVVRRHRGSAVGTAAVLVSSHAFLPLARVAKERFYEDILYEHLWDVCWPFLLSTFFFPSVNSVYFGCGEGW